MRDDWRPLNLARDVPLGANRALRHAIGEVQKALAQRNLEEALRQVDRAWRTLPDDAPTLAPIYARLLALEDWDHAAALRMLARAAEFRPDPELAALTVQSLLRLRMHGDARRRLELALARYCLHPGQALARVATEALQQDGLAAVGWVGVGATLDFIGQLAAGRDADSLQIEVAGCPIPHRLMRSLRIWGQEFFRLRPPQGLQGERFHFRVDGTPLVGSGRNARPLFALDGRARSADRKICGWARIGWAPTEHLRVRITDVDGHRRWVHTRAVFPSRYVWPFELDLRGSGLRGSRFEIAAELPDGRLEALPDSPLLLAAAVRVRPPKPSSVRATSRGRKARRVSCDSAPHVIIPMLRRTEGTLRALQTMLATVNSSAPVTVIIEAADATQLASRLAEPSSARRITLLRSACKQGYLAAINQALDLRSTHDAVLLDSDTLVFDGWLERLRDAAYSGQSVGTAAAFANNNGLVASYPEDGADRVRADDGAGLSAIAAAMNSRATVPLPVGEGCCLYIRRDCLQDVGRFDEAVFTDGYGGVADFCLRARARGWSHRLAADVFVLRAGGCSIDEQSLARLERSRRLLNLRYPYFDDLISGFLNIDPVRPLRRRLDERRLTAFEGGFVLLVSLRLTGGVARFVADRCRAIREQGLFPLVLSPRAIGTPRQVGLWTDALAVPNLCYTVPAELSKLKQLLGSLSVDHVEIQHFLNLDSRLIKAVQALKSTYDVYLHDYAWVCPRVTLTDGTGRYCGEPAVSTCEACVRKNGSRLDETISVSALRHRSARWLLGARTVFAPSADTAVRYKRYFKDLMIRVEPHGPPLSPERRLPTRSLTEVVRVALIGSLGEHKGYGVLLDCARDAAKRRLPLEFVVVGHTEDDAALRKTGRVFVTGRYTDGEVPQLLRRERAQLVFMPSVWPETWCYALDHAVHAGLPVLAFNLGAIAERLRAVGLGFLLPLNYDARQVNDCILRIAAGRAFESADRRDANRAVQATSREAHGGDRQEVHPEPSTTRTSIIV